MPAIILKTVENEIDRTDTVDVIKRDMRIMVRVDQKLGIIHLKADGIVRGIIRDIESLTSDANHIILAGQGLPDEEMILKKNNVVIDLPRWSVRVDDAYLTTKKTTTRTRKTPSVQPRSPRLEAVVMLVKCPE